jgi:D-alanyl-D-alanine carboxypeptidase
MRACLRQVIRISYILFFLLTIGVPPLWSVQKSSIVICAETGTVFHAVNADAITHPASLTKMMTLYLTFKALREKRLTFDEILHVSKHASIQIPTKLGLKPGETITVRNAIRGLVTKSANDASVAIAEKLGNGSEAYFAVMMTQQARKLGMQNTVFKNSSGVPNKGQITTARDMAILSKALYKHFPEYYAFFKEKSFVYKGQKHNNHNHLLGRVKGVDGIKTGFINASGFNLAASMVRDNRRIIAVVLGGESVKARDKKMATLLEDTHAKLTGKRSSGQENGYASLNDLIHDLGPAKVRTASHSQKTEKIRKAVYLSRTGEISTLETKAASLDDLFEDINKSPAPKIVKPSKSTKVSKPCPKAKTKAKAKTKTKKPKAKASKKPTNKKQHIKTKKKKTR